MAVTTGALNWPPDVKTFAIDVGGSGLKGAVLDVQGQMLTERTRIETPYPCPPGVLVPALRSLADGLPEFQRVSVGFPGLVRSGRVWNIPSMTRVSYGGPTDPALVKEWHGFDLATALAEAFGLPVKVANDADVQGAAVATGHGFEFVMTLGTGVGTALFDHGHLVPHLELGHAPFRDNETVEDQLGNTARKAVGNKRWAKRVQKAIEAYDRYLFFDTIHIGGGNAKHLTQTPLGPKANLVPNTAGILGGIRIWELDA